MFRQYLAAKANHPDAILLFRMGDFFEMFFDDALLASKALELTLTSRGKGTASEAPMCGIPVHAADSYIPRLVKMGHRVAICDQTEDPKQARGLVARAVVRVLSPGTMTDPASLDSRVATYIAAIAPAGAATGLAFADLSTGEFLAWEGEPSRAGEVLAAYEPREILHAEGEPPAPECTRDLRAGALMTPRADWGFAEAMARKALLAHFEVATLDGFGLVNRPRALAAAGALLTYLKETQQAPLQHISTLKPIDTASCLVIDETTRRNLELVRSLGDETNRASLVGVLDLTMTAMGGRRLRDWILRPLIDRGAIEARHDAVAELLEARAARESIRDTLRPLPDMERLIGRIATRAATPRDLAALRRCLETLPVLRTALETLGSPLLARRLQGLPDLSELASLLGRAVADEPPIAPRDGGVIREGYDPDVDRWRAAQRSAKGTLAELETRERRRTGISSLKVRYNGVFGYSLEVSRANLHAVPSDYIRKQTLVGGERFVTAELKEFEETLLKAETELIERELALLAEVVARCSAEAPAIRAAAGAIADIDALAAFAEAAERYGYCRPRLTDTRVLRIAGGRHPVVERIHGQERFIPNDVAMEAEGAQIVILTGPNMGGKSTYLRQTALIVLMAQAGSFVPAESAEIGVADRVFCRVGASDNLAGGQSTFLVEMSETANILHAATSRSIVLLDEIGRGTATFDGLSIAWAVAEWLHENPASRPLTLFATHYHELTELAMLLPRIRNFHISAREYRDSVLFLRRVEEGPADRSYGIQVARLAGIPRDVIVRAREILENLERNEFGRDGLPSIARRPDGPARGLAAGQIPLFATVREEPMDAPLEGIGDELRAADPDRLTPLEALALIARWKSALAKD